MQKLNLGNHKGERCWQQTMSGNVLCVLGDKSCEFHLIIKLSYRLYKNMWQKKLNLFRTSNLVLSW